LNLSKSISGEPSICEMIWAQAKANPDKIIIIDSSRKMTWRDLLARAAAYAQAIIQASPAEDAIIPVMVGRSVESIAAIIGCLIAGKAFSPISIKQPETRLAACLAKMNCTFVLKDPDLEGSTSQDVGGFSVLEVSGAPDKTLPEPPLANAQDLLYILFTSGSTGDPKGVMVTHDNILNTVLWADGILDRASDDVIGIAVNLYFDIAMFDLFFGLCNGTALAILSQSSNAHHTCAEIESMAITSIFAAPVFFSQFVRAQLLDGAQLATLRRIISGGDFFAPAHILEWHKKRPDTTIYNVWGPTETSIVNTMHRITSDDLPKLEKGTTAPVGHSNERMPFVLLDEAMNKVKSVGAQGEICMQGRCVTAGYFKDPTRTKSAYFEYEGMPSFRTGDIGSLDAAGELSIHGRIGSLIKVAGHRIDVGEVEGAATSAFEVYAAAAFTHDVAIGLQELWLALELKPDQPEIDLFTFKKMLKKLLPDYMIPKKIIVMEKIPTTPNAKIDRRAIAETFQTTN